MTNLLLKFFVKDYNNKDNPTVHFSIGKLAGVVGIICNCLLAVGKLIAGLLVGSVAIIADAANNLSDAISSIATLLGFRLAQRPADKDHPYGHARFEYLSAVVITAMIFYVGAQLVESSINRILNPRAVETNFLSIAVLIISIFVKLWLHIFFKTLGKKISSNTLFAASVDSRNDVVSTFAVLLSGILSYIFGLNIDGYVALCVAIFILYSGFSIAKETFSVLIGKRADEGLVEKISKLILSNDKVLGVHDLMVHDYGPGQCYASVHVELGAGENPLCCHDIIDDIEWDVLQKTNVYLLIHCDPVVKDDKEQNKMCKMVEEIIFGINPQFSMHDFRIVRGARQAKLVFDLSVPYSMTGQCNTIKQEIDEQLAIRGKNYTTRIHFDGNE